MKLLHTLTIITAFSIISAAGIAHAAPKACVAASGDIVIKKKCKKAEQPFSLQTLLNSASTSAQARADLTGPAGVPGDIGPTGPQGPTGTTQGPAGNKGSLGFENCREVFNMDGNIFGSGSEQFVVSEALCKSDGSEYIYATEYAVAPIQMAGNPDNRYAIAAKDFSPYLIDGKLPYGVAITGIKIFNNNSRFTVAVSAVCCQRNGK